MFYLRALFSAGMVAAALFSATALYAAGMEPETSLLLLNMAEGGGSINVKNSDHQASLLHVTLYDLPDYKDKTVPQVIATQPISRVEGGEIQRVRFVVSSAEPIKVEHFKRVIFEGIQQRTPGSQKVAFTVRQDLPVLIRPKGLPEVKDPWTRLTWSVKGKELTVTNPSPYVVRLSPQLQLLPSKTAATLAKTYILPGQTLTAKVASTASLAGNTQIKLMPASRYGFQVDDYFAPLVSL
ncbi:fimbria/pilus chaperone family protein [Candidatus Regiella insecticola]|uniref:Beta-fimbriae chaperone protein n=1 Tax=Candidatus Regiella insecticola TaxID=138073 RepID=A0A6L2ZP20_9ENTR|nr:fimbria/pilus chaperone family protein [Candidatus Regiella insecticola]GFN46496.1 beta-fimbriae chaperone protein [Candidatus Regiella insecticola]